MTFVSGLRTLGCEGDTCPVEWRSFVCALACGSDVIGGLIKQPHIVKKLFKELAEGAVYDYQAALLMTRCCPVLFDTLHEYQGHTNAAVPIWLQPILQVIVIRCEAMAKLPLEELGWLDEAEEIKTFTAEEDIAMGSWYPTVRSLRAKSPYYAASRPGEWGRGARRCDEPQANGGARYCTKDTHGHPSLIPGAFFVFCPHGVCLGFHLMLDHESPETAFALFYQRMESAPYIVIYDNGCHFDGTIFVR